MRPNDVQYHIASVNYGFWHIGNITVESETQGQKIWFCSRFGFRCVLDLVGFAHRQLCFSGIYVCEDALLYEWNSQLLWEKK